MMYRLDACFIHFRCMYRSQVHVSNLYKRIEINVHVPVNLTVACNSMVGLEIRIIYYFVVANVSVCENNFLLSRKRCLLPY